MYAATIHTLRVYFIPETYGRRIFTCCVPYLSIYVHIYNSLVSVHAHAVPMQVLLQRAESMCLCRSKAKLPSSIIYDGRTLAKCKRTTRHLSVELISTPAMFQLITVNLVADGFSLWKSHLATAETKVESVYLGLLCSFITGRLISLFLQILNIQEAR